MSRSLCCITKLVIIVLGEGGKVLREKVDERRNMEDIKWDDRKCSKWNENVFKDSVKVQAKSLMIHYICKKGQR